VLQKISQGGSDLPFAVVANKIHAEPDDEWWQSGTLPPLAGIAICLASPMRQLEEKIEDRTSAPILRRPAGMAQRVMSFLGT